MQAGLTVWAIFGALALLALGLVLAPILRGGDRGARRASYDVAVYRHQLGEVDADLARGVLTADEAAATRAEVARRLLAAADAEAAEQATGAAPRRLSRLAGLGMLVGLTAAAGVLYVRLGVPGLPDLPLAARLERAAAARADRPSQAEAEAVLALRPAAPAGSAEDRALVARLQSALESRPDDIEGHRLLTRSLGALGRWPEARAAQARVVELLGVDASGQDFVDLAELMILAAGGYVSPEASAALARALAREPENPVGRYYSGLALMQAGRPDLARPIWSRLLEEGPPDAPWVAAIQDAIGEPRRPSAADIEAARDMAPEARTAMIEDMVEALSDRLAREGGPAADWAQLIRSLGVLGRGEAAAAIAAEARATFAGDPAALALLAAAARDAGLAP